MVKVKINFKEIWRCVGEIEISEESLEMLKRDEMPDEVYDYIYSNKFAADDSLDYEVIGEESEFANVDFIDDEEKMYDFLRLTKEEFLASYSYLTEAEYENTKMIYGRREN